MYSTFFVTESCALCQGKPEDLKMMNIASNETAEERSNFLVEINAKTYCNLITMAKDMDRWKA